MADGGPGKIHFLRLMCEKWWKCVFIRTRETQAQSLERVTPVASSWGCAIGGLWDALYDTAMATVTFV